ncbi:MAG TPA: hypothetical protein VHD84_02100, partial [Candidatus Saccharimonadales bacterium]|nr:hypothetical protein [Candidatus Saccharimonadales bacterium]
PGSTPPPPPQLCEVQTAINYGQALPCRYAPPPGNFTATGSTYVNSQKSLSAACPAPNQGIVKSASSDTITISSPTFTGHGSTQSAANQDLANQEASWRTSNQSTADSQATSQAQSRLNSALQSCPQPVQHTCTFSIPPNGKSDNYTASVQMGGDPASSISVNWGDGTVNGSTSHTYPTPSPAPAGTYVYYQVSVTAHYSDGPDASCGTRQYAVEAPPTQPTGGPGGSGAPGKGGG